MALALAESAAAPPRPKPRRTGAGGSSCWCRRIDDDVMRNALARVSGELAAAPFKTITAPIDPDGDIMAQIESAGNDQAATAAFAIVRDRDPGSGRVTVWVSNRVSGITTVHACTSRAATSTGQRLGWRSRRSSWCAPAWQSCGRRRRRRPPGQRSSSSRRCAHPARFALAVGFGRLADLGGAPGFWAPQITRRLRPGRRLRRARLGERPRRPRQTSRRRTWAAPASGAAMLTLGVIRMFRPDRDRPADDRARRRGRSVSAGGRNGGRAGAGRPRSQHDHGLGDGERGRGAARSARASRPSPRRTCCCRGRTSTSASAAPTWQPSIVRRCSRTRGCLRLSRHIPIAARVASAVAALACGCAPKVLVVVDPAATCPDGGIGQRHRPAARQRV